MFHKCELLNVNIYEQNSHTAHRNKNIVLFQVYNGILNNSPMIGRYCGDNPPPVVESSGNTLRVIFRTDGSATNGGFHATYTSQNEAGKMLQIFNAS